MKDKTIQDYIKIADEALKKAEEISNKTKQSFYWDGPAYGMGGYYYPQSEFYTLDKIKEQLKTEKDQRKKDILYKALGMLTIKDDDYIEVNIDFVTGNVSYEDVNWSSSNSGWQASSDSC